MHFIKAAIAVVAAGMTLTILSSALLDRSEELRY
jgi:hypothetical protein